MRRFKVYLAGPITGLTFDEANDWRETLELPEPWVGLSPMRDKEKFRVPGRLPSTFDEGDAAVRRDLRDIRSADAVLLNLIGAEAISLGTMAEMGYAHAKQKPIIVAMEPERPVVPNISMCKAFNPTRGLVPPWDRKLPVEPNPHDHVFVHYMASRVEDTLEAAVAALRIWSYEPELAGTGR